MSVRMELKKGAAEVRDRLPAAYVERMIEKLGEREAEDFLASYTKPRTQGLRVNPLKVDERETARLCGLFSLTPVPWCRTGYTYEEPSRPGKHPYHAAGLYYIQEPSAMSAAQLLQPRPGETVLDLAAAPGGKTTQIAGLMAGKGLLIANEIHPGRAKILAENVERLGIANAVVTNAAPGALADRFPGFFDAIMLDAPCSGEGMFRKDPDSILEWSPAHVSMCAARQRDIIRDAVRMLKPGGRIGYSTCTFAPEENERNVEWLLAEEPLLELVAQERLWPHRQQGEGHYVAVLRHKGDGGTGILASGSEAAVAPDGTRVATGKRHVAATRRRPTSAGAQAAEAWRAFESLAAELAPGLVLPDGEPLLFGDQLYWLPHDRASRFGSAQLAGLKVVRPGLHVAERKKDRLEPAHALAMHLPQDDANGIRLSADAPETLAYLRGEALSGHSGESGWIVVRVDGFPLGWGKASSGQVKNHYPKGLRWL